MKESDYLDQIMSDKIVNTCFGYDTLILPLIVASKYLETEKKYNLLLTQLQLQKQMQMQTKQPVVETKKTEEETIDDKKCVEEKEEE